MPSFAQARTKELPGDGLSLEQGRVFVLKVRCSVITRLTKSVFLPRTINQTCEFMRSHIEALHGNQRKSIKMLNSVVQIAGKLHIGLVWLSSIGFFR